MVYRRYGGPEVLRLETVAEPTPGPKDVLIHVYAASLNAADEYLLKGEPALLRLSAGLRGPKRSVLGADIAGMVVAVGGQVTQFRPGDAVYGDLSGCELGGFAEYVCASEDALALKPARLSFEQAAAVPMAAVTALQGLRAGGQVVPGQKVLIHGASGGVGTFALQLARSFGATVTAVCSTRNVEMVRSLGADHVVDYTEHDFAADDRRYDVVLDNVGNRSLSDCRRVLTPKGTYVLVGAPKKGKWLGPLKRLIAAKLRFMFASQRSASFTAKETKQELLALVELIESGQVRSVIDRRYPLSDVADAVRYLAGGHASGKVIINVSDQP